MSFRESVDALVERSRSSLLAWHRTWERVPLGAIASVTNGYAFSSTGFNRDAGLPLVRIRDIAQGNTEVLFNGKYEPQFLIKRGDLLVGMDGDFRCSLWSGSTALLNQRVCKIHAHEQFFSKEFLFYLLPGYLNAIHSATSSITVKHLSSRTLEEIPVPLPPLAEQHRIVAEIERQFTCLDETEMLLIGTERKLKKYISAVIREAFTGNFSTKPLREIAAIKGGLTMHTDRPDLHRCAAVPYLRVANVQRGFIDLTVVKTIMATPEETEELALQPGDILFTEGGDRDKLGRGWLWQGEIERCIHQNHVFRARVNGSVLPKWVSYYANELGQQYFLKEGKQTTNLASINITKLGALPIPVPALDLQEQVLNTIEATASVSKRLADELARARAHAGRLRQAILAKAFSGQLVPQDPNDEPASLLLDRIRAERGRAKKAPAKSRRTRSRMPEPALQSR